MSAVAGRIPPEHKDQPIAKERRLLMRRGTDINDERSGYLWQRRVPRGGLSVIFSRPGAGKSTIAADMVSRVTRGMDWPDGTPCEPGHAFYVKGEGTDGSIQARMKLAGADPARYDLISCADTGGSNDSPMLDLAGEDGALLAGAIQRQGDVRLVVIDTLDSLYPSMRAIDNANIRKQLWPMQDIAEHYDLAIVILAHTNKGDHADPLNRLSGGRAIGGAARAVWYLGQEDRESDTYYMASAKVNDFKPAQTIAYSIVGTGTDTPGSIRWGDLSEVSAWDLDNPPKNNNTGKAEACEAWLRDQLAEGPAESARIKREASVMGYGDHVLRKARQSLEAKTIAAKGSVPPTFYVCLPGQKPPDPTPKDQEADA
jgi:hypothetical protein